MSDDKNNTGRQQDDVRVSANDQSEFNYLHQQFPNKTDEQILEAIKAAGPVKADIIEYLQRVK
ncbi:DUF3606 domain-containing protein [Longitalea luteola]|uniref:DUF3606 domain-containing protein n=1 Tax=Longitalea luteola TaxID=2812563 RepID=UPI001A97C661|nr:DUF3606 domain-containing protein [Longitalea luteola]